MVARVRGGKSGPLTVCPSKLSLCALPEADSGLYGGILLYRPTYLTILYLKVTSKLPLVRKCHVQVAGLSLLY